MRFARWTTALAILAASIACGSPPASEPVREHQVLAADRARILAMVAASRGGLEAMLHPSLTYTHSNGKLDTKASLIESLVGGAVNYLSIEPIEPRVRVRGDTAVLTSRVVTEVEAAGQVHALEMAITAVYFDTGAGWQLAAYQSVRLEN